MSRHIKNTACPKCRERGQDRSGNNLGVYEDGSVYCWKCSYYVPPHGSNRLASLDRSRRGGVSTQAEPQGTAIVLPSDCDTYIPAVARLWLAKYGLVDAELVTNRVMWSEYRKMLLFPYFDKYCNLVAWQGRSFSEEAKYKWYSQGDLKKLFHIIPASATYTQIVLVEDVVSAIKVGRVVPAMPLFGNNIGNRLTGLSHLVNSLVIWLDPDIKTKAIKEAEKARQLGFSVRCVFSECDPKEHTNEFIKEVLGV